VLGRQAFAEFNDVGRTEAVEARVVAAIKVGYGLDARRVLLTLHACLTHRNLIERYGSAAE